MVATDLADAILPAAALHQVIEEQRDDVVRLEECAVGVDDAEAVGVSIGRDADLGPGFAHLLAQIFEQMIVGLRRMSAEQHVAIVMHRRDLHAGAAQQFVGVSPRRTPHGVEGHPQSGLLDDVEIDDFAQTLQIRGLRIEHCLGQTGVGGFRRRWQSAVIPGSDLRFDPLRHFGQRRARRREWRI